MFDFQRFYEEAILETLQNFYNLAKTFRNNST